MEKIKLANQKSIIVLGILSLLLGSLILYFGVTQEFNLKISGAKLDKSTSKVLLCIISSGAFVTTINYIIKYISLIRYGDFVVLLKSDSITFPEDTFLKGYSPVTIQKCILNEIELENLGQHKYSINLRNKQGVIVGKIAGELAPYKTMPPKDFVIKIQDWLIT